MCDHKREKQLKKKPWAARQRAWELFHFYRCLDCGRERVGERR